MKHILSLVYHGMHIRYTYILSHTTSLYLVLQVFRLQLFMVAPVYAPDKVMEVVLVELLTVGLVHGPQDLTNGCLGHELTQL